MDPVSVALFFATNPFWMFVAISLGGTAGAVLGAAYVSRRIGRSHWMTRRYANLSYGEDKCPNCTVGTQYLHPDRGWGPIPEHLHGVRKGSKYLGSRQANVRGCTTCNMTGRVPVSIPGMIDQGHIRYIP